MSESLPSAEKDAAIAATVARLRERHRQGLVRITSDLWPHIPALLDAAEDGLRLRANLRSTRPLPPGGGDAR